MADAHAITEARALLLQFTRSPLKACHVATASLEVAFSRDPSIRVASLLHAACSEAQDLTELTAPHVGTLTSLAAIGTELQPGDVFAEIAVLDQPVPLKVPAAGIVRRHHCTPGALVEFGQSVIGIQA